MVELNIHEAKTHLSKYLDNLDDEPVLLCKRNVPIAKIVGLKQKRKQPRPVGLAEGEFSIPDQFFEPLPDDLLDAFEGK